MGEAKIWRFRVRQQYPAICQVGPQRTLHHPAIMKPQGPHRMSASSAYDVSSRMKFEPDLVNAGSLHPDTYEGQM
jgi:hypothetical protein